jgi:hypothetical protein
VVIVDVTSTPVETILAVVTADKIVNVLAIVEKSNSI